MFLSLTSMIAMLDLVMMVKMMMVMVMMIMTTTDDNAYYAEKRIMSEAFSRFARFVRNMLMFHRSTIDCFHLDIGGYKGVHLDPWLIDDIQVWLKFATDREVKDLSFTCDYLDDIASPRCVFTSQSLVTLTLCGSMLELYEHQPRLHMGTLRKLSLIGVHGSNEAFKKLISACPSLQELKIHGAGGLRNLNITTSVSRLDLEVYDVPDRPFTLNCPYVKSLDIAIRGTSPSILLDVIDVSSFQVVNVRCLPRCLSSLIIKAFLRHFRDVEVFTLSSLAFEEFCCVKKVDIPQNKWRSLALQPWWDNERCLQVIIELVKSSVDLEELVVYSGKSSGSEGNHEVLSSEISTSCVIPLLKNVTIHGYGKCCECQLQLVEFILRNAVVLEKLVITSENQINAVEELDLVKQVSRFKRASANVIVDIA
ncbi:F-box/LRR-repeat protein At3g03360-like [Silene latifolia]|uniref:F-box/LRR-repeat protein At3g03360-like n=1 Tax=Silene latifolia TaxID=37657 RepID=UPI003D776DF6